MVIRRGRFSWPITDCRFGRRKFDVAEVTDWTVSFSSFELAVLLASSSALDASYRCPHEWFFLKGGVYATIHGAVHKYALDLQV